MNSRLGIAILYVRDIQKMSQFYKDLLANLWTAWPHSSIERK